MPYEVFISYRRSTGADDARLLQQALKARGYEVFFDYDSLRDGRFDERIFAAIDEAPVFVLMLTEGSLDRCAVDGDWVRTEIERALGNGRRIVPVVPSNQKWSFPETLPAKLRNLANEQVSELSKTSLFEESVDKIVTDRFPDELRRKHHSDGADECHVCVTGLSFVLRRIPPKRSQPAFWMGEKPVTQALWEIVMGDNPSRFGGAFRFNPNHPVQKTLRKIRDRFAPHGGENELRPVECVSWNDCQDFLKKLNFIPDVRATGLEFRLPTKAEWEYACRAGSWGQYCCLADGTEITEKTLERVAWFRENSGGLTHPVAQKEPNAWGLRDMHGNVCEWTQTEDNGGRVLLGGSWDSPAVNCQASRLLIRKPYDRGKGGLGFRLCASAPQ